MDNRSLKALAYVDGSFSKEENCFASGVVLFAGGREFHYSERRNDENLLPLWNVAGETVAAWRAMKFCLDNGIRELDLYHDYEGIAKWCTGEWKANKEGTKAYRDYYNRIRGQLQVTFHKVKGHSGVKYNELADQLAGEAIQGRDTGGWVEAETS